MKCHTKGCTNPASGLYFVKTKGRFIKLDENGEPTFTRSKALKLYFCSGCGLTAHNKRSYNLVVEDGVERETFPMAYASVKLLKSLTPEEFHTPVKEQKGLECYCGHSIGSHTSDTGPCRACIQCNGFYDGACTNEP